MKKDNKYQNLNTDNTIVFKAEDHIITDQTAIRKALSMISYIPIEQNLKPLKPCAMYKYIGSTNQSLNNDFELNKEYPIYKDYDNRLFVLGKNGNGRLMRQGVWKFVKGIRS